MIDFINLSEKGLETYLCKTDADVLERQGLWCANSKCKIHRQVNLGCYGIADLVTVFETSRPRYDGTWSKALLFHLYELKKGKIDQSTLFQALRYLQGLKVLVRDLESAGWMMLYEIVLIGSEVPNDDFVPYLCSAFDNVSLYKYSVDFLHERITFKYQHSPTFNIDCSPKSSIKRLLDSMEKANPQGEICG